MTDDSNYDPNVVDPGFNRIDDPENLELDPIQVPSRHHIVESARYLGIDPSLLCMGGPILELVLQRMSVGSDTMRSIIAGEILAALREFREEQCGQ